MASEELVGIDVGGKEQDSSPGAEFLADKPDLDVRNTAGRENECTAIEKVVSKLGTQASTQP